MIPGCVQKDISCAEILWILNTSVFRDVDFEGLEITEYSKGRIYETVKIGIPPLVAKILIGCML